RDCSPFPSDEDGIALPACREALDQCCPVSRLLADVAGPEPGGVIGAQVHAEDLAIRQPLPSQAKQHGLLTPLERLHAEGFAQRADILIAGKPDEYVAECLAGFDAA